MNTKQQTTDFSLYDALYSRFGDRLHPQLQRKSTLRVLSYALEDAVIDNGLNPVVFTAFQKAQYYVHEAQRYERLGHLARAVRIYGRDIPGTPKALEQEWFVIVNEPRFKALLACRELKDGSDEKEAHRPFLGIWTYDREVVDYACSLLVERFSASDTQLTTSLEEVLSLPHHTHQQVNFVREVGDRILNELAHTNQKTIQQISRNQQLVSDLEHQEELLHQLSQTIETVKGERRSLESELGKLYKELTRSQQIMTEGFIEKSRFQQTKAMCVNLLQQLQAQLKSGQLDSAVATANSSKTEAQILVEQIQRLMNS